MAELDWTQAGAPRRSLADSLLLRLPRVIDWEALITLGLLLLAVTAVTVPLEEGGWSKQMPPLTTVGVAGIIAAMLLARSRLRFYVAWPLGIVVGAGVVFWQVLVMAGPGDLEDRLVSVHDRFGAWFDVAFSNAVTNDSLPFNTLVISLTWLGVFIFAWSVYRWHNAWIGLVPGGAALVLDLVLVGDQLTGAVVLYMLCGFLLVMQTNLLSQMGRWRQGGAQYPALINVTFLHMSLWALVAVMAVAWIVPVGPYNTPAPIQGVFDEITTVGRDFVRLAGPLRSHKVVPVHSYSGVLPFQGSVNLGERELLSVRITDPNVRGPLLLRGAVYDRYEGGGWTTGDRREVPFPPSAAEAVRDAVSNKELEGLVVPLEITLEAKSVVGTVIFTPGVPIAVSQKLQAEVPAGSTNAVKPRLPTRGWKLSDEKVMREYLASQEIGLQVLRDAYGAVLKVEVVRLDERGVLGEAVLLNPGERIKRHRSYNVTGFVSTASADDLREAGDHYPRWITQEYLQLPYGVPDRVRNLAEQLATAEPTAYDRAKALETYLRQYPVDYQVEDVPPGRDTVDYFLFESRRGYFDYHASAMVVMLRTLGVPARLAVGLVGEEDDIDTETGRFMLRDRNVYAWPEVYFPGSGWVAFNPSPDRPADLRPTARASALDDDRILRRSLLDDLPVSSSEGAFVPPEGVEVHPLPEGGLPLSSNGGSSRPWVVSAITAFLAAIAGAVFLGWQRSVAGMPYPQQVWEKTVRLATWGGLPPEPGQTPHDYAGRLGKRFRGVRGWRDLADAYTASLYGRREIGEKDAGHLREIWPDARGAMLRGVLRRPLRREPRSRR